MILSAVEFPPIENLVEWPALFGDGIIAFNKIALAALIAMVVPALLFLVAGRRASLVPRGVQTVAEGTVTFMENQIARPGIGHGYEPYLPLLLSFFTFIFVGNLFEVIPFFQMPLNGRMGPPLVVALVAFFMWIGVAARHHGLGWFKAVIWPSYVPLAIRPLVGVIELFSVFIIRPFSHALRLFANMLAGHILLVTFGVLCISVWSSSTFLGGVPLWVLEVFTFPGLVMFTAFEVGVSFIQAFVFALLAAVYIGGALHPDH